MKKTILTAALLAASAFAGSAYASGFAFSPALLHTYPGTVEAMPGYATAGTTVDLSGYSFGTIDAKPSGTVRAVPGSSLPLTMMAGSPQPSLHGVVLGARLMSQVLSCPQTIVQSFGIPCADDGQPQIGPFDTVDVLNLNPLNDGDGSNRAIVGVDTTGGVLTDLAKPVRIIASRINASDDNARRAALAMTRTLGNPVSVTPTRVTWTLEGAVEELIYTGPDRLVALAYESSVSDEVAHRFVDIAVPDQAMDGL